MPQQYFRLLFHKEDIVLLHNDKNQNLHDNHLKEVTIPKKVTEIGTDAFMNCKNLKEIQIPEGVNTIWLKSSLIQLIISSSIDKLLSASTAIPFKL